MCPGEAKSERHWRNFRSGDDLDVLDPFRVWCKARVVKVRHSSSSSPAGGEVFITYLGWSKVWDEWIDAGSGRLQPWERRTAGIWTGGPDFPWPGTATGGGSSAGSAERATLVLASGSLFPCAKQQRTSYRNVSHRRAARRDLLPTLVLDDDKSRLLDFDRSVAVDLHYEQDDCEPWCNMHYEDTVAEDEKLDSGETCAECDNGETGAGASVEEECSVPPDETPAFVDDDDDSIPETGMDSFSFIGRFCSSEQGSVVDDFGGAAFDILSFASGFDVVSHDGADGGAPAMNDLSVGSSQWEVVCPSVEHATSGGRESSVSYRDVLLKKKSVEQQASVLPSNGTVVKQHIPKERSRRHGRLAGIAEEKDADLGWDDWLGELREQAKNTAGGKSSRMFKGNPRADKEKRGERDESAQRRDGRRRLRETCGKWTQ